MSGKKAAKKQKVSNDDIVVVFLNKQTVTHEFLKNGTDEDIMKKATRYDNCKVFVEQKHKEGLFGKKNSEVTVCLLFIIVLFLTCF